MVQVGDATRSAAGGELDTREKLIASSTLAFSANGFGGASIREIERVAGVKRGLLGYHFGSKEALWCTVIAGLMKTFQDVLGRHQGSVRAAFIDFSSQHPELLRMLILEGTEDSPLNQWITDTYAVADHPFFSTFIDEISTQSTAEQMMSHYVVAGAASYVFTVPAQCRLLYGVDPASPSFVAEFTRLFETLDFDRMLSGSAA